MSERDVVDMIYSLTGIDKQSRYCNVSRYHFAKSRKYPANKAGDKALSDAIEANMYLLTEFYSLVSLYIVEAYFPDTGHLIHIGGFIADSEERAIEKMHDIILYRVSKWDLHNVKYKTTNQSVPQ